MAGRLVNVVQVAPPSVVSATAGSCGSPWVPASQHVVAETQSMANAYHCAVAQAAGVMSVHCLPPSVVSATAGPPVAQVSPVAQQTEVVAHDTATIWKVDGTVAWPVQVRPAFLVTSAAWPMVLPPFTRFLVSGVMTTQKLVPGAHDTGDRPSL